ncbi:MAG: PepSY-like domain-containing protein [Lewinellaceae bacterium]|nr:PepSY-like domain-containing protein [Phaeodactylibacter sp.]MCB9039919.1 PepSY-like domain-containing protein [Lewinellaceae bacterium]
MRIIAFFFTMALFSGTLVAQDDAPAALKEAFAERFPNAKSVEWEDPEDGVYEVEFKQDKREMTANFGENGDWLETEVEIEQEELPATVKEAIARQFSDLEFDKAETVSSPERDLVYEVVFEQDETTVKVTFSPEGEVLDKTVKSEEEEGKE